MSLGYDPEIAAAVLSERDEPLARLIRRVGPFQLELRTMLSPFQSLLRAIIYQQLSGKAAATIYARVLALFPDHQPPTPQQLYDIPPEDLRRAGMSHAKILAAKDLAAKTLTEAIPTASQLATLPDEEIIARLTTVRGVGRWTVEMLLIFQLGRPDVLPVHDLGIRKGFMRTYRTEALPDPADLRRYGERWQPYRSVASWYLWRAVDLGTP